jgi:hypothetical protein
LQLAKCTYAGMRAKSRGKSGRNQYLKFSKNNPNCALRAAFRCEFHPSRRLRRAPKVPGISPKWAQNGPKSAVFEGVLGVYSNRLAAHVEELVASVLWHGQLAREAPTTRAGSPCCTGCPTRAPAHFVGPRSLPGLPDRCRSDSAGGRSNSPKAAELRRNWVSDGRNPAGCRPQEGGRGPGGGRQPLQEWVPTGLNKRRSGKARTTSPHRP